MVIPPAKFLERRRVEMAGACPHLVIPLSANRVMQLLLCAGCELIGAHDASVDAKGCERLLRCSPAAQMLLKDRSSKLHESVAALRKRCEVKFKANALKSHDGWGRGGTYGTRPLPVCPTHHRTITVRKCSGKGKAANKGKCYALLCANARKAGHDLPCAHCKWGDDHAKLKANAQS